MAVAVSAAVQRWGRFQSRRWRWRPGAELWHWQVAVAAVLAVAACWCCAGAC